MNKRICKMDMCGKPHAAKGFCQSHYKANKRYGDPLIKRTAGNGELVKFLESILSTDLDGCIDWPYGCNKGYGKITFRGTQMFASRAICIMHRGEPLEEMQAAHDCGRTLCVNPNHIFWKTAKQNNDDKKYHGTFLVGEKVHNSKLTEDDVRAIRISNLTAAKASLKYGVTRGHINMIRRGSCWRHIV